MTTPLVTRLAPFNAQAGTSPVFHLAIERASVGLLALAERQARVGHSLAQLSLELTGVDFNIGLLGAALARIVEDAARIHGVLSEVPDRLQAAGRNTYDVQVTANAALFFARSFLDQLIDICWCSLSIQVDKTSMNWALGKGASVFKKSLEKARAPEVFELLERHWKAFGRDLKDYRDEATHLDSLVIPPIELVVDPKVRTIVGARLFLPNLSARDRQDFVDGSSYFVTTRNNLVQLANELLPILADARKRSTGSPR